MNINDAKAAAAAAKDAAIAAKAAAAAAKDAAIAAKAAAIAAKAATRKYTLKKLRRSPRKTYKRTYLGPYLDSGEYIPLTDEEDGVWEDTPPGLLYGELTDNDKE